LKENERIHPEYSYPKAAYDQVRLILHCGTGRSIILENKNETNNS